MKLTPQPGILDVSPYVGGTSKLEGKKKVMKLSSNETPLGASEAAKKAYKKAADSLFRYPDGGATALREAIAETYDLDSNRIVCGAGSDEIIQFLCTAYAGVGDEIIYSEHGFLMYAIYGKIAGAKPVAAPEIDLTACVDTIMTLVSEKTKIVFLANPNNPTGTYMPASEVARLREELPEEVLLVIDGAYAEYVSEDDYTTAQELVDAGENTVMTRTFSKIYGLAALRIGWAYCPESVVDVLNRVRGPFNVSAPAIAAATAAVKDQEFVAKAKEHNDEWLPWLSEALRDLGLIVYPSVGNFILVDFPEGDKNAQAADAYLRSEGIIVRDVSSYGLGQCLRITIGTEEENKAVAEALKAFMKS